MNVWQKLEVLSKVIAALLIPLAIAWLGNVVSLSNKQRDAEIKFVEIASAILRDKPASDQGAESRSLRSWAVDVLNKYSGVKMSAEAQAALVQSQALPAVAASAPLVEPAAEPAVADTWGLVFGGDATLEAARHEVTVTARKMGLTDAEVFRRGGSFHSVRVFVSRAEAADALGRAQAIRADAYVVDMSRWCPSSVKRDGYFECAAQ